MMISIGIHLKYHCLQINYDFLLKMIPNFIYPENCFRIDLYYEWIKNKIKKVFFIQFLILGRRSLFEKWHLENTKWLIICFIIPLGRSKHRYFSIMIDYGWLFYRRDRSPFQLRWKKCIFSNWIHLTILDFLRFRFPLWFLHRRLNFLC